MFQIDINVMSDRAIDSGWHVVKSLIFSLIHSTNSVMENQPGNVEEYYYLTRVSRNVRMLPSVESKQTFAFPVPAITSSAIV